MSKDEGISPWESMARELAQRPNSPRSLQIMSAISSTLAPVQAAIAQVKQAISDQLAGPGPEADAAFLAAKSLWEREARGPMDATLEADLRREVADEQRRRAQRSGSPDINQIIDGVQGRHDVAYELGHLQGLHGSFHRLWGVMQMGLNFGKDDLYFETVATVRGQFEVSLGRSMTETEWQRLEAEVLARPLHLGEGPEADDAY
jgi:hypothetical protein